MCTGSVEWVLYNLHPPSGILGDGNSSLTKDVGVNRSSRRSCSDISQLSNDSGAAVAAASVGSQHGLHSPRGSVNYDGVSDERLSSHRKISTQLSDPPPSLSRSQSPRPSIASIRSGSDRRSIEREAIRIVIDDVDCSSNNQPVTTSATPTSSTVVACLYRDPNYCVGHGFTAGFGLSLISRKNVLINWIDPHGKPLLAKFPTKSLVYIRLASFLRFRSSRPGRPTLRRHCPLVGRSSSTSPYPIFYFVPNLLYRYWFSDPCLTHGSLFAISVIISIVFQMPSKTLVIY